MEKRRNEDFECHYKYGKPLTERELQVLRFVCEGKTNVEIAKLLNISTSTAKAHVTSILRKLAVSDRLQAAVLAVRSKLF